MRPRLLWPSNSLPDSAALVILTAQCCKRLWNTGAGSRMLRWNG